MSRLKWVVCVTFFTFLSGCGSTKGSKDHTLLYLTSLNDLYKGEDLDYKGQSAIYVKLLAEPVSCTGWAGSVGGFGAHLSVAPVELSDGTVVIAVLKSDDKFAIGYKFWGHLVVIASDAFHQVEKFIPKSEPKKEAKPPP